MFTCHTLTSTLHGITVITFLSLVLSITMCAYTKDTNKMNGSQLLNITKIKCDSKFPYHCTEKQVITVKILNLKYGRWYLPVHVLAYKSLFTSTPSTYCQYRQLQQQLWSWLYRYTCLFSGPVGYGPEPNWPKFGNMTWVMPLRQHHSRLSWRGALRAPPFFNL